MNGGRICRAVLQVLSSGVPRSPAWPWLEWHLWGGSYALPEMGTEGQSVASNSVWRGNHQQNRLLSKSPPRGERSGEVGGQNGADGAGFIYTL